MAEETLVIKIVGDDQASAVLSKLESNLSASSKNIQKQTEATTSAFETQMTGLLALGNAAMAVDHIFSSYENLQIKLENASIRVANAEDRLSDAQFNLRKMQESGTASAEDLAHAQDEVTRANRGLEVSQNNLQRAQNMAIGTYIQMGVGILQLVASLPKLIALIRSMEIAETALNIAKAIGLALTNPIGAAIAIAAAAAAVYAINAMSAASAQKQLNAELADSNTKLDETTTKLQNLKALWEGRGTTEKELALANKKLEAETLRKKIMEGKGVGGSIAFDKYGKKISETEGDVSRLARLDAEIAKEQKLVDQEAKVKSLSDNVDVLQKKLESTPKTLQEYIMQSLAILASSTEKSVKTSTDSLLTLPPDIYTYHHIVTVYDSSVGNIKTHTSVMQGVGSKGGTGTNSNVKFF